MTQTRFLTTAVVVVLLAGLLGPILTPAGASPAAMDDRTGMLNAGFTTDDEPAAQTLGHDAGEIETQISLAAEESLERYGRELALLPPADVSPTGWAFLAAYSRFETSDPLENPVRSRIYDAIVETPGTYSGNLADSADVSRSTVRYHVRVLEAEGLIAGEKIQGKQRYFPRETSNTELLAALEDDVPWAVLTTLYRSDAVTGSQLAHELDRAPSTTSYHLSRLAELGLIEQTREDGAVVNRLTTATRLELDRRTASGTTLDVSTTAD